MDILGIIGVITPFWKKYKFGCIGAEHPSVISVFLSKEYKLHTTRSWDFLGLEKYGGIPAESAWWKGKFGEDTIIGNLDSGKSYTRF